MDLYPFVSFNAVKAFNTIILALPVGIAKTVVQGGGSINIKDA